MPLTHVRTFRVRHYECDAHGYVHHANFLRYMQEAAFDASAAAGYDMARYVAMDRHWLIRETQIEHMQRLRYGDLVAITTYVSDFRRIRSRRAYEFRLPGSEKLVARALTDWVFLESSSGRPASIPEEMKAAFFPEGPPWPAPPRTGLPSAPHPPPGAFQARRSVRWQDLDSAHHVNNAMYLAYLEECGVGAAMECGWSPLRMADEGFTLEGQQHQIEYRLPALLGDELELTMWLSGVQATEVIRHSTIHRVGDGALLAQARTVWATVDADTRQPIAIPEALLASLSPQIAYVLE
jgi:acyl-CoA thioester hydrolase